MACSAWGRQGRPGSPSQGHVLKGQKRRGQTLGDGVVGESVHLCNTSTAYKGLLITRSHFTLRTVCKVEHLSHFTRKALLLRTTLSPLAKLPASSGGHYPLRSPHPTLLYYSFLGKAAHVYPLRYRCSRASPLLLHPLMALAYKPTPVEPLPQSSDPSAEHLTRIPSTPA